MKKKTYQQPEMRVVKSKQTDMICTSGDYRSPQNESYEEGNTDGWYNNN